MARPCDLEQALGRSVPCNEGVCAFWDDGCAVAAVRSDLPERTDLAQLLLTLKERLEGKRQSSFRAMLPPGLRD